MYFHAFLVSADANCQWNQSFPPNAGFDFPDFKTHRKSSPESGCKVLLPISEEAVAQRSAGSCPLLQSQEHGPLPAPHKGCPELLCHDRSEDLCELVASGVSRKTASRQVRSMERGMESGEEEQDKQSTRARVTARWEEKLNDGGGCDNRWGCYKKP